MAHKKKPRTAIKLALLVLALAALYLGGKEAAHHLEKYHEIKQYQPIVKLLAIPENATVIETSDIVRDFVHNNSHHAIDKKYYRYHHDHEALAKQLIDYAKGNSDSAPHMECSTRSRTMKYILQHMKIEARKIDVYAAENNFASHVFLEVLDPKSNKWHIQDPDHNLSWKISESNERAKLEDLIKLDISNLKLCAGLDCNNKEAAKKTSILKPYYGLAFFKDESKDQKITYWNKKKFPKQTKLNIDGREKTICDFRRELCEHKIVEVE